MTRGCLRVVSDKGAHKKGTGMKCFKENNSKSISKRQLLDPIAFNKYWLTANIQERNLEAAYCAVSIIIRTIPVMGSVLILRGWKSVTGDLEHSTVIFPLTYIS